jgi:hypothetical protein
VLRCGRRHGCEPAAPVRAGELPNYGLGRLTGQPLHGAYRARALPVHAPASMRRVSSVRPLRHERGFDVCQSRLFRL